MNDGLTKPTSGPKRRLARSRGTLEDLSKVLWQAIMEVKGVLEQDDPMMKLKAAHAIATVGGTYIKALEIADLEARIIALETGKPVIGQSNEVVANGETIN